MWIDAYWSPTQTLTPENLSRRRPKARELQIRLATSHLPPPPNSAISKNALDQSCVVEPKRELPICTKGGPAGGRAHAGGTPGWLAANGVESRLMQCLASAPSVGE